MKSIVSDVISSVLTDAQLLWGLMGGLLIKTYEEATMAKDI